MKRSFSDSYFRLCAYKSWINRLQCINKYIYSPTCWLNTLFIGLFSLEPKWYMQILFAHCVCITANVYSSRVTFELYHMVRAQWI